MSKSKWIITGLVVLIIILCMMTIYVQSEYGNMRIAYTRVNEDYASMKVDYEKLYTAYYDYDKKVKYLLVNHGENVNWADDSSAYFIKKFGFFTFAFLSKPKMEDEYHLWVHHTKPASLAHDTTLINSYSWDGGRVDTLKPHQFITRLILLPPDRVFVAPSLSGDPFNPDTTEMVSVIRITK
jgi:hypothetical protein